MVNGDAGELDAPAGKPPIETSTEPLNPFNLAVDTLKLELELPGAAVIAGGDTPMLKSGVGSMVKAKPAECASVPDVPSMDML